MKTQTKKQFPPTTTIRVFESFNNKQPKKKKYSFNMGARSRKTSFAPFFSAINFARKLVIPSFLFYNNIIMCYHNNNQNDKRKHANNWSLKSCTMTFLFTHNRSTCKGLIIYTSVSQVSHLDSSIFLSTIRSLLAPQFLRKKTRAQLIISTTSLSSSTTQCTCRNSHL